MTDRHLIRGRIGPAVQDEIRRLTAARACGGVNIFLGVTRADLVDGRPVAALEYEAYEAMADREIDRLEVEADRRWSLSWSYVRHSVGLVRAGETGVVIAVGAAHRDEAYAASRFLIDGLKSDVPIWKREIFLNGHPRWARCDHQVREAVHARV